jgi:uncharacterized protein with HEPN domain
MPRSTLDFLKHIQEELAYISRRAAGLSYDEFINDDDLKRAFVRSFEVVGEACKNVPESLRNQHTEFNWSGFARLRDRLIHQYWGVDYAIIWDAVTTEIPTYKEWIDLIVEQESSNA